MVAVKKKKMSSVTLIGKRWFNRRKGSTYHSCEIIVDGREVHKIHYAYGYDDQWEWNAAAWLETNGYMSGREHFENSSGESMWRYCERKSILYVRRVDDVRRKKDL